ncbi:MAG: DNA gyrase subunit A [Defluviitaleaceae bacterium]|nr:DNA gyrase subunit A [Defluviitaleaceae bacterium]
MDDLDLLKSNEKIDDIKLEDEVQNSFISYAMSVIASRALPDVRDGLKPVHRRIVYSMYNLGLRPGSAFKKCARIVGDTMGNYHPHGDASIYDALTRMAQDFSLRYPLVDGHGNFGSIDGDAAAAYRYTEARLHNVSMQLLTDIDKNTVDFVPNYDEQDKEPAVLPSRLPNFLLNGASGIAVGMATNTPPHNLNEVVDAVTFMIDNFINDKETDIEDILNIVKGPDFPTGASIMGTSGITQAYKTGKGSLTVRGITNIETFKNGREMIVITELPYQCNKASLVERIGELVRDKKIEGVSYLRDESNRKGIRVVVELKKDANANIILNNLYKHSGLQTTYSINMLALVNNEPRVLNLKSALHYYIEHQVEVVTRRTQFDLDKAKHRQHILQGYLIALDNIDEVISIIRSSKDTPTAKGSLEERFSFTEIQSEAIVQMRLRALTGLERSKLEEEFAELELLIAELMALLENKNKLYTLIKDELLVLKSKFGDERRTRILPREDEMDIEDLYEDEMCVVTMSHLGYIKRMPLNLYKSQHRGGRGVSGMKTREEDGVKSLFITNAFSHILFFTSKGKVFKKRAFEVPETKRESKGTALVNLINLGPREKVTAIIPMQKFSEESYFIMVTKDGIIKKTTTKNMENINKNGLIAIRLNDTDELITVKESNTGDDFFIATHQGIGIKFSLDDVRPVGRTAIGVRGINLLDGDYVVGADIADNNKEILIVSENGYGKCTLQEDFRHQKRAGKGSKVYKVTDKTGNIVDVCQVSNTDQVMIINSDGVVIRININEIRTTGRVAQGVKLINLNEAQKVMSIAKISEDQLEKEQQAELEENNQVTIQE